MPPTFTLADVARRLDVPQHKLIHLCEKGVVVPEIHDAAGRGSSRVFSANNLLELAVALRLRDMMMPVSAVAVIVHVLRRFAEELPTGDDGQSLPESLRGAGSPELRVIVSDGHTIYFSLAQAGKKATLFGGIPLGTSDGGNGAPEREIHERPITVTYGAHPFGGLEGSKFARLELSVSAVARSLSLN